MNQALMECMVTDSAAMAARLVELTHGRRLHDGDLSNINLGQTITAELVAEARRVLDVSTLATHFAEARQVLDACTSVPVNWSEIYPRIGNPAIHTN